MASGLCGSGPSSEDCPVVSRPCASGCFEMDCPAGSGLCGSGCSEAACRAHDPPSLDNPGLLAAKRLCSLVQPARRVRSRIDFSRPALEGRGVTEAQILTTPPRALRGGISKSFFQRRCQYLAINAHKMAPRTTQWFQERHWNGLLWGVVKI